MLYRSSAKRLRYAPPADPYARCMRSAIRLRFGPGAVILSRRHLASLRAQDAEPCPDAAGESWTISPYRGVKSDLSVLMDAGNHDRPGIVFSGLVRLMPTDN